jgi:hypothetical protein
MSKTPMTPEERAEGARSFARALEGIGDGKCISEASEEFWALLRDIHTMAKSRGQDGEAAGALTLALKVSVNAKGEAEIGWDVTAKKPKKKRLTAVAWVTKGGNLTFEVPRQLGLPNVSLVNKDDPGAEEQSEGRMLRTDA